MCEFLKNKINFYKILNQFILVSGSATARYYSGKIPVQFKLQVRQLRAYHADVHYCAAMFKIQRDMAVDLNNAEKGSIVFVSKDDKAKVDFGEPGQLLSTGVRNRKSLAPVNMELEALDHDMNSKGSVTPSVTLLVDIPEDPNESFYRGDVYITLKDSVFQPSNSFRTALEMEQVILEGKKHECRRQNYKIRVG